MYLALAVAASRGPAAGGEGQAEGLPLMRIIGFVWGGRISLTLHTACSSKHGAVLLQQAAFQAQLAAANAGPRPPMAAPGMPPAMPMPPRPMAPPPGMGRPPMSGPPPGFRPGRLCHVLISITLLMSREGH